MNVQQNGFRSFSFQWSIKSISIKGFETAESVESDNSSLEHAKPVLYLINPGSVFGRVMEMEPIPMPLIELLPTLILAIEVNVEIIPDDAPRRLSAGRRCAFRHRGRCARRYCWGRWAQDLLSPALALRPRPVLRKVDLEGTVVELLLRLALVVGKGADRIPAGIVDNPDSNQPPAPSVTSAFDVRQKESPAIRKPHDRNFSLHSPQLLENAGCLAHEHVRYRHLPNRVKGKSCRWITPAHSGRSGGLMPRSIQSPIASGRISNVHT